MKFLVDAMLGKLAKWLRILGYDTLYFRDLEDEQLIGLAEVEGRVLLTGDEELWRHGILISSDDWREQLRELAEAVELDTSRVFTRCIECNVPLDRVGRAEIEGEVPPYVFATQEEFGRCPGCGRIYWKGTHFQSALAEVERIINER
ncbi:MAG: Mut7-C RNAse domain-containing protein [Candidatus Bipolaricaulia bacterium]